LSRLDGRVVALAGATGGLGPAVARRLADEGATLALTDRDQGALDALAGELGLPEERLDARTVDLLDAGATSAWAAALAERFGGVHGVAHLVGGWRGGKPIGEAPLEDWTLLHDLLVRTLQHTSRAFLPALKAAGERGRFALVSAKAAAEPTSTNAAYAAAKAAAEAWTLALAHELDETRGTANIVVVNAIVTPRMRAENPDKEYRTFTAAEDIAEAIAFLFGDSAAKMNRQRVKLHG
jgi:NAD(P)-dependent dehydrogenase (short-subunit alcohol dehydrogenase family)